MHEGIEEDDKYRMVEDEFLATAQQFTVHLHAAEYKRQEKAARARNADAISSISRPVTQDMPNHTKRKVAGLDTSKSLLGAIQTLQGSKVKSYEDPDESSDGEGLAYFNTTLRGLMDSPRRKAASLSSLPSGAATRAAAGFQRPTARRNPESSQARETPRGKGAPPANLFSQQNIDSSAESYDLDDDLDAPVPTIRYTSKVNAPVTNNLLSNTIHHALQQERVGQKPLVGNNMFPKSTQIAHKELASEAGKRSLQARPNRREGRKETEVKSETELDLIPTFL